MATAAAPAPAADAAPAPAPATTPAPQASSSLYVGDLDRDVTEAQLFEIFSQIGPVASIRVCRDAVTRRSLGYAYVNYQNNPDASAPNPAQLAIEALNYSPIAGRPMRIMWSHRDPAYRKSGVGNIFIKNLDKSIDNKALHDTFNAFGNILSCKVALDPAGESKGYGFVHFETEEAAKLAVEKVNGMLLEGKKVYVGPFLRRTERSSDTDVKYTNIFVKNLDEEITEEQLSEMFGKHGEVVSLIIMKDEEGKSKGFGFVNMAEPEEAANAVADINGKEVNGKEIFAGRAQKKAEREAMLRAKFEELRVSRIAKYAGMNLYCKNLADDVDDETLRSEFAAWGTITSAKVMRDGANKSKGFGFVCYANPEEATRAVTEMNGRMLKGKPVYVALAQRREVRRVQLEQQHQQRVAMQAARGPMGPGGMGFPGPSPMYFPGGRPPMGPGGPMMGNPYQMMPGPGRGMPGRGGPRGMMMGPGGMMVPGPQGMRGGRGGRGMGARGPGRDGMGRGPGGPMPGRGGPAGGRGGRGAGPREGGAPAPGADGVLTAAMLAAAPPEQQKQLLGERLFPQVANLQPDLSGKITGMLLEMDNSELLLLLESPEALEAKVDEAVAVLKQHNAIPEGAVIREKNAAA